MASEAMRVTSHQTGPFLSVSVTDEAGEQIAHLEVYDTNGSKSVFASTGRHDRVLVSPATFAAVEAQARRHRDSREWRPGFPAVAASR